MRLRDAGLSANACSLMMVGMLFAVVRLRIKGRPLTRSEVAAQPKAVGELGFR